MSATSPASPQTLLNFMEQESDSRFLDYIKHWVFSTIMIRRGGL